ncbi:hypothetical protein WN48_01237 [Eufriesea mexicana]|uniref:Uncharacterized protein n=1 Tax=Eufriesea mexicana TaxID=516756 RepID=A0A310SGW7_9HYME|nr:hypothetical protein WN48_01237 [Eufriesea mexicana]
MKYYFTNDRYDGGAGFEATVEKPYAHVTSLGRSLSVVASGVWRSLVRAGVSVTSSGITGIIYGVQSLESTNSYFNESNFDDITEKEQ